jgi:uncharacterized membrane protein HdeD (DUF308 family)
MNLKKIFEHIKTGFSWFYHVGWIYVTGFALIITIILSAIALANSSPITKISVTLAGIIIFQIVNAITVKVNHQNLIKKEKLGAIAGILGLVITITTLYSAVLSAFVVPAYIAILMAVYLVISIALAILDEKKVRISPTFTQAHNLMFVILFSMLAQYLAKLLSWF